MPTGFRIVGIPLRNRITKAGRFDRRAFGLFLASGLAAALAACVGPAELTPTPGAPVTHPKAQSLATGAPQALPSVSQTPFPGEVLEAITPEVTSTPGLQRVSAEPEFCPAPFGPEPLLSAIPDLAEIVHRYDPILVDYLNGGGTVDGVGDHLAKFPTQRFAITGPTLTYLRSVDLTGDQDPEIVIGLDWLSQFGALYVFGRGGGAHQAFVALPLAAGEDQDTDRESGVRALIDLNGNGRLEILFSYITKVEIVDPTSDFYQFFPTRVVQLLEWNGTIFDYLPFSTGGKGPSACRAEVVVGNLDLLDMDEDGELELVLVSETILHPHAGPQRVWRETWDWRDDHLQLIRLDIESPEFRFQAVQDGDDQTRLGNFDRAVELYQDAIFDPDLLPWSRDRWWPDSWYQGLLYAYNDETPGPFPTPEADERQRLEAYARYRLLLVHAARGDPYSAQIAYDELENRHGAGPGLPYAILAQRFWETYSADRQIAAGCKNAGLYAQSHAAEVLFPLGAGVYGWANRNYEPIDICPFLSQP